MDTPIRQENGDYLIGTYSVEMFGSIADTCTCPDFVLAQQHCEHMRAAIEAEKRRCYAPPLLYPKSILSSNAGFSLLK